ncbi:HD domain-containing protein [Flavobacterium psychrotrophum]|uniref:HD domain-containing protein n=1 Tax=Flavobacterium psychrotrophum TaxID=2294119 RepID=UPI000E30CE18|nr:HD domain-containing protein [Flavobacterium psychrotrophum]
MLQKPESEFILARLKNDLAPHLYYHSVNHTLDVYERAADLAKIEGIPDNEAALLLTAALYHDSGYLYQSAGHEEISCEIAQQTLPEFGYSQNDIEKICEIITATRLPQTPADKLGEIISDADLDYLGRDDFFELGDKLYLEMCAGGNILTRSEWNDQQIAFLKAHTYFTKTAQQLRNQKKQENLNQLLSKTVL